MQPVVVEQPYRFVAPHSGEFLARVMLLFLPRFLRKNWGIDSVHCQGHEHLQQSLAQGHGVLLASNHCRPCDPLVLGMLAREVGRTCHVMASWHVFFEGGRFRGWLARRLGAFSVNRWGMDREAIKAATSILVEGRRPLIIFPEGHITRTNDRLGTLLDGTAYIARRAAREREKANPSGKVVVHPISLRYSFRGDLAAAIGPVLDEIETRLSWTPKTKCSTVERILRVGQALLSLKEIEYLGQSQPGAVPERIERLIDHLLEPLEKRWISGRRETHVVERAKALRSAIVPGLVSGELSEEEREQRWSDLRDIYLAQQLACYPPDYIASAPTPERILETVERFEEDLTDTARVHRPLHARITVGPAIDVDPVRERGNAEDPLMRRLEQGLRELLFVTADSAV